ncbi:MAG: NAD(P)-dependent oxidoreductase [Candidatus Eremiobacteraeota bacterium]|nr:NAD(P)-dependent oxidoreductase [Candidatus Eremiobacteraeota bacterium]
MRVGVLGLGIMGSAYAKHLAGAGYELWGFDPDPSAAERLLEMKGRVAASPRALAETCDVVISALASTAALDAAFFGGDGVVAGAHPGLIVLEAGTFALDAKERVREKLAERDAIALDTPVSGTGAQALHKDLMVFASGDGAACAHVTPVMSAFARDVRYVGAYGNGSKHKYVANLLVTIHNLAAAEAVVLAEKAGLDPKAMVEIIAHSAATSRMFEVRAPMMAAREYEPPAMKLDVYQKDIDTIAAFARHVGAATPLFSASLPFYAEAVAEGRGGQDTAAIVAPLRAASGLPPEKR